MHARAAWRRMLFRGTAWRANLTGCRNRTAIVQGKGGWVREGWGLVCVVRSERVLDTSRLDYGPLTKAGGVVAEWYHL